MDQSESFKVQIEAKPGLITGDFNVVKIIEEKSGNETLSQYESEFGKCLFNNKVMEHSFVCNFFAWGNKGDGGEFVAQKLDRVLGNIEWLIAFN